MADCNWIGKSGKTYRYEVHAKNTNWADVPGNYIFAKQTPNGWLALYMGETGSLRDRITPSHEKWDCAERAGMTHIHAHTNSSSQQTRRDEESNLIQRYNPPCNG